MKVFFECFFRWGNMGSRALAHAETLKHRLEAGLASRIFIASIAPPARARGNYKFGVPPSDGIVRAEQIMTNRPAEG
jgi:hypothetical protein